jgi:hypothetical protein
MHDLVAGLTLELEEVPDEDRVLLECQFRSGTAHSPLDLRPVEESDVGVQRVVHAGDALSIAEVSFISRYSPIEVGFPAAASVGPTSKLKVVSGSPVASYCAAEASRAHVRPEIDDEVMVPEVASYATV